MSHWQKTEQQRCQAWQAVRELGADVALLQETVPPPDLVQGGQVVYREIGGGRPWGSAVVGFTLAIEPVTHLKGRASTAPADLLQTVLGSVAVARARVDGRLLTFVSMYGAIENGYADTTVHRQLSDLAPLFDNPQMAGAVVLGGDLNITTQWTGRQAHYRAWQTATLGRIKAFGLVDCLDLKRPAGALEGCGCPDGESCRHIRTQYHPRSSRPWQNDYVFASRELLGDGALRCAEVIDDPYLRQLSDHLPLRIDVPSPAVPVRGRQRGA